MLVEKLNVQGRLIFMTIRLRYGSYYVHVLMNLDDQYPGLKKYLDKGGFSTQAQEYHFIRTATDQRGEQTINKDAKISGK